MARRAEDMTQSNPKVSTWKAPPGLLERIEADEAAYARGEAQGMDGDEMDRLLLQWIAEGEALCREAGEDEAL